MFNPLESVNKLALSVANSNNLVSIDGVNGDVGGVKSALYNAVPLTKLKLVILKKNLSRKLGRFITA